MVSNTCIGCVTCRTARIKCDERHPFCEQCEHRGIACSGYKPQLKWVETRDINPDSQGPTKIVIKPRCSLTICSSTKTTQNKEKVNLPTSIMRNPNTGPRLHSSSDVFIFTHWAESLPDLVYPNPEEYTSIRDPYLAFVWKPDSILLPAALAAGASHLYALGVITQVEVLERKQKALLKMVECVKQQRALLTDQGQELMPSYISEEAIAASLALIGMEVMQGSQTQSIIPLIRGMKAQLEERRKSSQGKTGGLEIEKPTPMMAVNVKMMAYMDTLCCVPCARKPTLDRQFWQEFVMPQCHNSSNGEPDVVFGYSMQIAPLIGESASLVNDFFSETISHEDFVLSRDYLLDNLVSSCRNLPPARQQADCGESPTASRESVKIKTANACIAAAVAYSLATQIFLIRADESTPSLIRIQKPSKQLLELAESLSAVVSAVSLDTHAAAMMIWPVFVLGCESKSPSTRRHQVELLLEKMLDKNKMLNIAVALDLLRNRIWNMDKTSGGPRPGEDGYSFNELCHFPQNDWVRFCWKEKLQLCLA